MLALRHLIGVKDRKARDVYIAGDSAGGNLCIAILSHPSHPHPALQPLDLSDDKLGGAFLISPWVTQRVDSPSMKSNANKDYITADSLIRCAKAFLQEGQKVDNYITPLDAHEDWWKDPAVRDICVFMGGYELFAHDLVTFARKVRVHNPGLELVVAPYEIHVQLIVDRRLRIFGESQAEVHLRR